MENDIFQKLYNEAKEKKTFIYVPQVSESKQGL